MLNIKDLKTSIGEKTILENINIKVNSNEIHVIMGPNGSGKSTLSDSIIGRGDINIDNGNIIFEGKDLSQFKVDERARLGIFKSFQAPISIPGLTLITFLKEGFNSIRSHEDLAPLDTIDFLALVKDLMKKLNMKESMLYRSLNEGFSGGEMKKCEILQMLLLKPKLAILDEIDSGLDIDALKVIATNVKEYIKNGPSIILITHYQRLLDYIKPDYVHILMHGKLVLSGGFELVSKMEEKGYQWLKESSLEQ